MFAIFAPSTQRGLALRLFAICGGWALAALSNCSILLRFYMTIWLYFTEKYTFAPRARDRRTWGGPYNWFEQPIFFAIFLIACLLANSSLAASPAKAASPIKDEARHQLEPNFVPAAQNSVYFAKRPSNSSGDLNFASSFENNYLRCLATMEQVLASKELVANPYLPHKIDLWLVPWSTQSSVVGYQPGGSLQLETSLEKISGVPAALRSVSQSWVDGWPLLQRRPTEFSRLDRCSNNHHIRTVWNAVYSVKRGTIIALRQGAPNNNYGNYIMLLHDDEPNSPVTFYAHLAAVESGLQLGARVAEGQRIATTGARGQGAEGRVHLHLSYFSSVRQITDEDGELTTNIGVWYRKAENPVYFVAQGTYPANTYIGNYHSATYEPSFFNQLYRQFSRYHEGIDFSGSPSTLIANWQQGLTGREIVAQYRSRADKQRNPWLYQLQRR